MSPNELLMILLIVGTLMVAAEIFIPDGILGTIGALVLVAAIVVAFRQGVVYGMVTTVGIVILQSIVIALWIRYFPRTWVGRRMTVNNTLAGARSGGAYDALIGKEGPVISGLRPGGIAVFDGRRVDVVADGQWVEAGARVRVLDVKGNRVMVRRVEDVNEMKEG